MTAQATTTPPSTATTQLRRAVRHDRREHRAGHPGQARRRRAGAALPARRGPPPHRGRARRRQDQPGQGAGELDRLHVERVQFTPDLLPSDVVGVTVWNRGTDRFEFRPGPVFANIVLGDEINRASPKTQSALLEAMEERQVTVDGTTYPLESPFMVIATQNPIEHEGTYPLPESQLDRFLMRISVGYPARGRRAGDPRRARRPDGAPRSPARGHRRPGGIHGGRGAHGPRGAGAEGLPGRPGRRHPPPPERPPRHVAPRHALPPAGVPGPGRGLRPQLRHPRRHQGAGRARCSATASSCRPTPSSRAPTPAPSIQDVLAAVPVPTAQVAGAHPPGVGGSWWGPRPSSSRPACSASSSCTSSAPRSCCSSWPR